MSDFYVTTNGKLARPKNLRKNKISPGFNQYGQQPASLNDYVFIDSPGLPPSAELFGRVTRIGVNHSHWPQPVEVATVETLVGDIRHDEPVGWLVVISYATVQQVKDYYAALGQSGKIKVTW